MESTENQDKAQGTFSTRDVARELISAKEAFEKVQDLSPEQEAVIDQDPRVQALAEEIQVARASGNKRLADKLVKQSRELRLQVAGAEEPSEADREAERQAKLKDLRTTLTGKESEEELLQKFGMYTPEGKATIDSPLFSDLAKRAFRQYLKTVESFDELSHIEQMAGTRLKNVGTADKERLEMHNMTAALVSEDLGLSFAEARRLVAKMRDEVIPGSSEEARYGLAARRAIKLAEQYGYDAGAFVHDQKERLEQMIHPKKETA